MATVAVAVASTSLPEQRLPTRSTSPNQPPPKPSPPKPSVVGKPRPGRGKCDWTTEAMGNEPLSPEDGTPIAIGYMSPPVDSRQAASRAAIGQKAGKPGAATWDGARCRWAQSQRPPRDGDGGMRGVKSAGADACAFHLPCGPPAAGEARAPPQAGTPATACARSRGPRCHTCRGIT